MRWRSDLPRLAALTVAAVVALSAWDSARAASVETLAVGTDLVALVREGGVGAGIGEPSGRVAVVGPTGSWWRVVAGGNGLALKSVPAAEEPPLRADSDLLPDGIVTHGRGDIRRAWLTGPTERYRHGILGDAIEASGLALERLDGKEFRYRLDGGSVFEDRRVRLVDLDRDGRDEAIVVHSYLDKGAALAVFALGPDSVEFLSETLPIGAPNRWLNLAGADDYDGDGRVEVAFVETPHIGGTLKLYEFRDGRLVADHVADGFSNHAIGSREQQQSATLDWDGDGVPDLALPDGRRRSLRVISFAGGTPHELANITHSAPIVTAVLPALLDESGRVAVVYGLSDGTLVAVRP